MRVVLTAEEQALATTAATARFARRRSNGSQHRWNRTDTHTTAKETEAIGAEIAAARATGRRWQDTDTPDHNGDIGEGIQVRHTQYQTGRLLIHPDDCDDHQFILVTGAYPDYTVAGWTTGRQAKQDEFWQELQRGRPCFAVPQRCLTPVGGGVVVPSVEQLTLGV